VRSVIDTDRQCHFRCVPVYSVKTRPLAITPLRR
jgi:hypothetical protein